VLISFITFVNQILCKSYFLKTYLTKAYLFLMDSQDTKFTSKIIYAILTALIIGVLIAFYYSYAQSRTQINYLEHERDLLVEDMTLMKADIDRLSALNVSNDIELQTSRYKIQQLLDSVGKLTFTIEKVREYNVELRRLGAKNDSLKLKNDFLSYNNRQLTEKYEASQREVRRIQNANAALTQAEAKERDQIQELNEKLKTKKYLELEYIEGSALRFRSDKDKPIRTNKASTVKRLKGSVVIAADSSLTNQVRVLYFQFVDPNFGIIEDNANTINVLGNVYSKRKEFDFTGAQQEIVAYVTIPVGSLEPGEYFLNVFEDDKLLQTSEFILK
jgi:FtsZ-binding cell division protein ZapB